MFSFRRWWLLCGAVLVGVVALNGVVDAKAAPARGSVCVRVGAKALDGVSGRGLVCVQTKVRGLRWLFEPTTVTTTTIATSTSATTTVASAIVAPRVVSASSVTGNAVITIADMSPDTGVYAVQWVLSGQSFNSFSMYRTTTKTMTVPYLSCTRTYTLRVFVMQENWQMTDGFVNQNVTPHSATFDLTMPACTATAATVAATTTVALTCATGGACAVGETGPGGGIVFYVQATGTFACGATLTSQCKYLEAAPANWLTGTTGDPTRSWATSANTPSNQITSVSGADGTLIGTGYQNSLDIDAQAGNVAATSAAVEARAYQGNGKTDWHLPSKDELNQMCKWQRGQAWVSDATICNITGTLNSGTGASGFSSGSYWSSSEVGASLAWLQDFYDGGQYSLGKNGTRYVRPVRAFG